MRSLIDIFTLSPPAADSHAALSRPSINHFVTIRHDEHLHIGVNALPSGARERRVQALFISHYYGSDRRSHTPSRNRTEKSHTFEHLRTGSGKGHKQKWLCIAWRSVLSLARVLCTKNNISGKCAIVIFQFFFLGVCGWDLFLTHCYAFKFSFLRLAELSWRGCRGLYAWVEVGS